MKLLLKWFFVQLIGSFVMSIIVCFVLIGKVDGFYDPSIQKVLFFTVLFFCFSLLFGLPILLSLYIAISRRVLLNKIGLLFLFIGCIILSSFITIFFFHLNFKYVISLCCSYFPLNIFLFFKNYIEPNSTREPPSGCITN